MEENYFLDVSNSSDQRQRNSSFIVVGTEINQERNENEFPISIYIYYHNHH
jgi:hypothetical protein